MKDKILRIGRFYSSIIVQQIPLFIAYGLLIVVFSENGWFPNAVMCEIADFIYQKIIPLMIGYMTGRKLGGKAGGIAAVITCSGIVIGNIQGISDGAGTAGITGAMLAGPIVGMLSVKAEKIVEKYTLSGFEMLTGNLMTAMLGCGMAVLMHFGIMPWLGKAFLFFLKGVETLTAKRWLPLVSVLFEPAKVFFLNNSIHHSILVPAGMGQVAVQGSSVLFLLETNPGPGLGLLTAMIIVGKLTKKNGISQIVVQLFGGIHEVYFPYVLSNLKLLLPLIAGSAAGCACFMLLDAGLSAPVLPGSILMILLMCTHGHFMGMIAGICVSALVTCLAALPIMISDKKESDASEKIYDDSLADVLQKTLTDHGEVKAQMVPQVKKIYFVCDAGVGSSAMGAALFRRKINAKNSEIFAEMTVLAVSSDDIPSDADVIICQKDFRYRLPALGQQVRVFEIDSLMNTSAFEDIIEDLERGHV